MKKQLLILAFLVTSFLFGQNPKVKFQQWKEVTTTERNAFTPAPNTFPQIYNITTDRFEYWDGDSWECMFCLIGTQDLEDVIAQDPVATSQPTFEGGINVGDETQGLIDFKPSSPASNFITWILGSLVIEVEDDVLYNLSNEGVDKKISELIDYKGDWDASTNTPTLANTDIGKQFKVYRVSVAGTHDFGAGDITFGVGDYVINNGSTWIKFIDNNQSGNSTPIDGNTFTGSIDLTNGSGSYYDTYDLATDGQITFSIASSPVTFAYSYLIIDSDGTTEFATKPNLDAVFDEQYNIPANRILSDGLHRLYILKTPTGAALSIPVNQYDPDVVVPTVTSATIEDAAKDELVVVFSEAVNIANVTGLSLDNDFSAITIDSIISGDGTDTITLQLSAEVGAGDTGDFIYGGTNTIEDLSGNALASGNTAVTNNASSGIVFTLESALTEGPTNFYTKSGLNAFTDGYAVSTTTVSGAFTFRVELATTSDLKVMLGFSTDGTNRAWNTAPAWNFAAYNNQGDTTQIRILSNGSPQTVYTPPVSAGAGTYLEVRRDASNNCTMWYDGTQYGSSFVVSGAVYLHFHQYADENTVNNPTFIQN